jgi:alkylation response protein AidB-like acyl-CoA dehydrogenase
MTTTARERTAPAGGAFITGPAEAGSVFTPERLSAEHRAMRDAVRTFVEREVSRVKDKVEGKDYDTHRSLLARLGRDGYLGIDIPERYGGAGLDRISSLVINEAISTAGSFAVTYSAHTGIGSLPLVFFGTDAQKARYLPGLADGSRVGAYALTEPSA